LEYRTKTDDPLRVQVILESPVKAQTDVAIVHRYLYWELPPSRTWTTVSIPLSEMKTPEWWFKRFHVSPDQLPLPDYSRLKGVGICESEFSPSWKPLGVELRSVVFDSSWLWVSLLGILIPVPLLVQFLLDRMQARRIKAVEEVSPMSARDEEAFGRIAKMISENFKNSGLTLAQVSKETRIPEGRISQVLEKRTGLHFKPYLNQVRIDETIRLLMETDMTASEIAFHVGYSNTTHFNRVFKSLKLVSAGEYRRMLQGQKT
jgi:AraC-like DNA-binding protein